MADSPQASALESTLAEMASKIAVLEERTNHQSGSLQQIQQSLQTLSQEIYRRLPYSVAIYFSVAALIIGVLGTLLGASVSRH